MKPTMALLAALLAASSAVAAPKLESVQVQPSQPKFTDGKPPEVEVSVSVSRTRFDSGNCDARVEFGDGEGRTLDFGVASKRSVRHVYRKSGSFTVVARGAGSTPCGGMQQMPLVVTGAPEAKKPEPKKAAPEKKAEKKALAKKAPAKKKADEKKKADGKKASVKKDQKKKADEKKKAETK